MAEVITGTPWSAISAAVGLLTAARAGLSDSHAVILSDLLPGEAVAGLEVVAIALLDELSPGDGGACVLERYGLRAACAAAQSGGPV